MKKYILLLLISSSINIAGFAETKYWIGSTGIYSNGANWNTMSNGSGTSGAPVNTDDIVIDRNATITIDGVYSPSSLWIVNNAVVNFTNTSGSIRIYTVGGTALFPAFKIESGSTFNIIGNTAIRLVIAAGSTASIFGVLDISGNGSTMDYTFGAGVTTIKTGGKIRYGGNSGNGTGSVSTLVLESGSTYEIYKNGGIFPTGTYHPNSLLLNTGSTLDRASFSMNTSTGSYGNYDFNAPGYIGNFLGFNNNYTFNNVNIIDDGIGIWVYSTSTSTAYTLTVNGNLIINTGCTLDINRASSGFQTTTILVKGNIENNGLITETNGNIGSQIEIGGNTNTTFSTVENGITNDVSLRINKGNGTNVTALTDIILPNTDYSKLTLTSGNIDMQSDNKLLFIQNPAFDALIGGTVASHVIGKLKRNSNQQRTYEFPVSDNAVSLAKFEVTTTNTNASDWIVEFLPLNPFSNVGLNPGIIDVVTKYAWEVTRSGTTPSNGNFITLYYGSLTTSGVLIPAQLKVVQWNGSAWNNLGGNDAGGSVANSLGSTGGAAPADPITSFGTFALGGVIGVIPISLEYFTGTKNNKGHTLSWKAACSGTGNITFEIERSLEGSRFNTIETITASTLRCLQPFEITDTDPLPGLNYYRLKITDLDGKISYSSIVTLVNKQRGLTILSLSPNPVSGSGNATLQISSAEKDQLKIIIHDMTGKQALIQNNLQVIAGYNQLPLNIKPLATGAYKLTVIDSKGNKFTRRFVKE